SAARLEPDSRRRQLGKEFLDLAAPQLPPQHRLLVLVNSMNLKDMFGRVQPNPDNRHSDGSSWLRLHTFTAWHIRCRRGPSTPTSPCWRGALRTGTATENIQTQLFVEPWVPAFAGKAREAYRATNLHAIAGPAEAG